MKKLILNEDAFSTRPDAVRRKVYDKILDLLYDTTCNLNILITDTVPGYNPEWCAEESIKFDTAYKLSERLATVYTDILFENK